MRQVGTLSSEQDAQVLVDYLLTLGIEARVDRADSVWSIWVFDENQVDRSKEQLNEFLAHPLDPRYQSARREAESLRRHRARKVQEVRKNYVDVRSQWGRTQRRLTTALIVASALVALWTRFGETNFESVTARLMITTVTQVGNRIVWYPGLPDIREGQVWRLITPIFLHFTTVHLLFNMLFLYQLGGLIEPRMGALRFGLLVVGAAVASNVGQFVYGGPYFGGMSGVNFALFGYAWVRGRLDPASGLALRPDTVFMVMVWFFVAMTGYAGPIANAAHAVGLLVGALVGYLQVVLMRR